jgi:hypothetical protein
MLSKAQDDLGRFTPTALAVSLAGRCHTAHCTGRTPSRRVQWGGVMWRATGGH